MATAIQRRSEHDAAKTRRSDVLSVLTGWNGHRVLVRILACALGLLLARSAFAQDQDHNCAGWQGSNVKEEKAAQELRVPSEAHTPALGRVISLHLTGVTLEEALRCISKKADLNLVYGSEKVAVGKEVTLSAERITVHGALQEVLQSTGLRLMSLSSGHLVVVERESFREKKVAKPQKMEVEMDADKLQLERISTASLGSGRIERTVTGVVTDAESGATLPGVNVQVVGTKTGAATNSRGRYRLAAPSPADTLRFSFVGYEAQTVPIRERATITVAMHPTTLTGTEVVVTGYTTQQKQDLTGAVDVVNIADMQKIPEARVTDQLKGMASGLNVISSGLPGQDPQVRIRGISTFGNNTPLFVVDGVPTQFIGNLDPNDIQSIQVLKDASAASVYGARAANGVIVVETKKGEGDVTVEFSSYAGMSKQPDESNPWDLLDPQGRAELEWQTFRNSGIEPTDPQYGGGDEPRLPDYILPSGAMEGDPGTDPSNYFVVPYYTDPTQLPQFHQIVRANKAGTDWFDEIMETAPVAKTNLTVSGGGDLGSYLFSAGYLNQQGTLRETRLERYSIRANTTFNVTDNLRIGENLSYTIEENMQANELVEGSAISMAMRMRPIIPVRDVMGNWAGSAGAGLSNAENPVAMRERSRNNQTLDMRLFGNAFVELTFLENFRLKTLFGGAVNSGFLETFQFPQFEESENETTNHLDVQSWNNHNWTLTNTLSYQNTFARNHNVSALIGAEFIKDNTRSEFARVEDFFSFDPDFVNLENGSGAKTVDSRTRVSTLVSQFGKLDYNFRGRYFASTTLRRDGSSKFLNDRYGLFPAFSLGWRLSEEPVLKNVLPSWLTNLKVRGGWGIMGNQLNVNPNNAFSLLASDRFAYDVTNSNSQTVEGFFPAQTGAPDANWEKNKNKNIGVDLAVFDGRLEASVDYYEKNVEDLLFAPERPGTAGEASPPFINVASMENAGFDVSVHGKTEIWGVRIQSSANLTTYDNEITAIAEGFESFSEAARRFNTQNIVRNEVGHEISSFFGFKVAGLWQSQEEIDRANAQAPDGEFQLDAAPGRFRYEDVNGDGQITAEDRTFLGSPNPDFTLGFNVNLSYKNWAFSTSLFSSVGAEAWNQVKWWTDFFSSFNGAKSIEALENSWKPGADNSDATVPIQELERSFSTNQVPNSYFVEDASYLRIRSLRLGYMLPERWIQRFGVESLQVYVQASNVVTFTGYSNPEPEIGGSMEGGELTPVSSTGAQNDPTDVTSFGIDEGAMPTPRQILGGIHLTF